VTVYEVSLVVLLFGVSAVSHSVRWRASSAWRRMRRFGVAIPEGTVTVAGEEGILDLITLIVEAGTIRGVPRAA
jgi:acyl CoA:acetate/3-ketoacid CoA transferase